MSRRNLPDAVGRYEIVDRLGRGGMGVVYRARDPKIGRAVAIKLLHVSDGDLRDRFLREARAAGNLKHQNIVTVYDYGEHDEQPFIVMEYVEGITLADQIRRKLQLPVSRKLELMLELAAGLDYAHNEGVVHRDVKPGNLMIASDGSLKILDFGIARVDDSRMTMDGAMLGTPNYMSPEQVEGRPVDRRSDVFAAGLVFYELLTYQQAFAGETMHLVMNAIARNDPRPIREICPELDPALDAIVDKAIKKEPAQRYQSMAAMAVAVRKVSSALIATQSDDTILVSPPTPRPAGRTPRPDTNREILSRRRAETIEHHLQAARRALDEARFADAIEAAEQAALLDPDEPRALSVLERARAAFDRQRVDELLAEARVCLDRLETDQARELADRALEISPDAEAALRLTAEIERVLQAERQRQQAIAAAVERARDNLAQGNFEAAIRAAGEVLTHDPTHQEGHALTREALRALEEQRRQAALEKEARAVAERERARFSAGGRREALEALRRFAPPHPLVTSAFDELVAEDAAIERRAAEEEARRAREALEAEQRRQAEQRWAARQLKFAQEEMEAARFDDALEVLRDVERVTPGFPGLQDALTAALAGQETVKAEARRASDIARHLKDASDHLAAERLDEARASVDSVFHLAPDHPDALQLRSEIDQTREVLGRRQHTDRAAAAACSAARERFDAGEHAKAVEMLRAFSPPNTLTTRALVELESKLAELRLQEEQRRRADAIRVALEAASDALSNDDFESALREIDKVDRIDPGNQTAVQIRARATEGQTRLRRRVELDRRARETAADAREQFASGDAAAAITLLENFFPPHPLVAAGLADLRRQALALAAQRREAERVEAERQAEERRQQEQAELDRIAARSQTPAFDPAFESEPAESRPTVIEARVEESQESQPSASVQADEARPAGGRSLWAALAVAIVILGAGATVYFLTARRNGTTSGTDSGLSTVPSSVTATSVAATSSVPIGLPTTVPSPSSLPTDMNEIAARAAALLQNGDLSGAARLVIGGLRTAPDDGALTRLLRSSLAMAESLASSARRGAEAVGRSDRREFAEAVSHFDSAVGLRRSGRSERAQAAVDEYLTAAKLFDAAAKAQQAASSVPVTIAAATTSVPQVGGGPLPQTSVPVTAPPVTAPPTTVPVIVPRSTVTVVPVVDLATIQRLLNAYAEASRALNVAELQKIYPSLPELTKTRIESLRRTYSRCDYTFSNVTLSSSSATEATVQAEGVESCKPKTAQREIVTATQQQFQFKKNESGSWVLTRVFVSQ